MSNEHMERAELAPELDELTRLARASLGRMTSDQRLRGELVAVERFAAKRRNRPAWLAPTAAVLLAASSAAALFVVRHRGDSAALSYVIENQRANDDSSPSAGNRPPQLARFSDGTEVRIDQGAQARVRSVTNHGAEVALSRGSLHASVVHSTASEWRFEAGPFVVHVTGTAFGLAWDPELDRFDLRLEHGSVTVSSAVINAPIPVLAGQWLTIRPRINEVFIRDLAAAPRQEPQRSPDSQPSGPEAEASADPATKLSPDVPSAARSVPDNSHTWARDLLQGKADRIVDDALRRGLEGCLNDSSPSELSALADAARYTRRNDIARRALLTERRRFAGSPAALDAALLMGRLAESEQNYGQALIWFNAYLTEAPAGAHASEALGRKMAIVRHAGSAAEARSVAEEYVGKYPDGIYSSAARAILKSP